MKRKVLIFGIIASLSVFGITRLGAADYYGKVPSEKMLAQGGMPDEDGDGVDDLSDMCPGQKGDADHCGCPPELVIVFSPGSCVLINDPDDPNYTNDSDAPVGGGLLLLLGSALAYGLTKRKNKNINFNKE